MEARVTLVPLIAPSTLARVSPAAVRTTTRSPLRTSAASRSTMMRSPSRYRGVMESPLMRRASRLSRTWGRSVWSQPSPVGRPASSKKPSCPAWARPSSGMPVRGGGASPARAAKPARDRPVTSRIRVRLSVEGQRGRGGLPGPKRLEGLKAVASSPARRARAEALSPSRRARVSIADQIWAWDKDMADGPTARSAGRFQPSARG